MPQHAQFANIFTAEEDKLIIRLKERENLGWAAIAKHLPSRTPGSLQVRYSRKLYRRDRKSTRNATKLKKSTHSRTFETPSPTPSRSSSPSSSSSLTSSPLIKGNARSSESEGTTELLKNLVSPTSEDIQAGLIVVSTRSTNDTVDEENPVIEVEKPVVRRLVLKSSTKITPSSPKEQSSITNDTTPGLLFAEKTDIIVLDNTTIPRMNTRSSFLTPTSKERPRQSQFMVAPSNAKVASAIVNENGKHELEDLQDGQPAAKKRRVLEFFPSKISQSRSVAIAELSVGTQTEPDKEKPRRQTADEALLAESSKFTVVPVLSETGRPRRAVTFRALAPEAEFDFDVEKIHTKVHTVTTIGSSSTSSSMESTPSKGTGRPKRLNVPKVNAFVPADAPLRLVRQKEAAKAKSVAQSSTSMALSGNIWIPATQAHFQAAIDVPRLFLHPPPGRITMYSPRNKSFCSKWRRPNISELKDASRVLKNGMLSIDKLPEESSNPTHRLRSFVSLAELIQLHRRRKRKCFGHPSSEPICQQSCRPACGI